MHLNSLWVSLWPLPTPPLPALLSGCPAAILDTSAAGVDNVGTHFVNACSLRTPLLSSASVKNRPSNSRSLAFFRGPDSGRDIDRLRMQNVRSTPSKLRLRKTSPPANEGEDAYLSHANASGKRSAFVHSKWVFTGSSSTEKRHFDRRSENEVKGGAFYASAR